MALIACPECGKQISDKAVACPLCGFPIAKLEQAETPCLQSMIWKSEDESFITADCPKCNKSSTIEKNSIRNNSTGYSLNRKCYCSCGLVFDQVYKSSLNTEDTKSPTAIDPVVTSSKSASKKPVIDYSKYNVKDLWLLAYRYHYKGSKNDVPLAIEAYKYIINNFSQSDEEGYASKQLEILGVENTNNNCKSVSNISDNLDYNVVNTEEALTVSEVPAKRDKIICNRCDTIYDFNLLACPNCDAPPPPEPIVNTKPRNINVAKSIHNNPSIKSDNYFMKLVAVSSVIVILMIILSKFGGASFGNTKEIIKYELIKNGEPIVKVVSALEIMPSCYDIDAVVTSSPVRSNGVPTRQFIVKLKNNRITNFAVFNGMLESQTANRVCNTP